MSKYNKAWAAGIAQAVVQLAASFLPFEPDLEQALGVLITAAIVWLVPNRTDDQSPSAPAVGTATTLRAPFWSLAVAAGLAVLVSACAGLGDRAADTLLGQDGGPASRVYRAQLLTEQLQVRYPTVATTQLQLALEQMQASVDAGLDLEPAALAYQIALGATLAPIVGTTAGQSALLRLA